MGLEIPSIGNIRDRGHQCILGMYWHDQRFEYSGSDLIYMGVHRLHNTAITDGEWAIWKFTWDGSSNLVRQQGPLEGTWDGRAALDW